MTDESALKTSAATFQLLKSFGNLLKEFPRQAADDFIYDESTLKKISRATTAMSDIQPYIDCEGESSADADLSAFRGGLVILSRLIVELPKDPADEFVYDREIHQMVEAARGTVGKLNLLFPEPE